MQYPNVDHIIVQYINQCPSWRTLHLTLQKQVMDCRPGLVIAFCFFLVTMMYTNGVIFLNICSGLSKTQSQSVWVCWAGWVRLIYWNMIVVRPEDNSKHLYSLYLHHISISPWIWALLSIAFRSICNIYSVVVRSIWREYHQIKGHFSEFYLIETRAKLIVSFDTLPLVQDQVGSK